MFGQVDALLMGSSALLRNQRVVLVTSIRGAKRRSSAFVQYMLRQKLNCTVFCEVTAEPSMLGVAACEKLAKHTGANVLVALGGSSIMDVGKLACFKAEMDHFLAIPTVPCAGSENNTSANLFNFEQEQEICFPKLALASHSCYVDSKLAVDDKIAGNIDVLAFMNTLTCGVDTANESFVEPGAVAMQSLLSSIAGKALFTPAERKLFFDCSLALKDNAAGNDKSFGFALTNAICREIPLPRTLVRGALFYPSFAVQTHVTGNAKLMQALTNTQTPDQAMRVAEQITKRAGMERGIVGLLPQFFPPEQAGKLIPTLVDLFKHTATEHQNKHGGELFVEEMLFGVVEN